MDLLQFTANQLKEVISKQAPELKGYKKKKKDLLISIIKDKGLDVSELEVLMKKKEIVIIPRNVSTLVTFGN